VSGGQDEVNNEILALTAAIQTYGTSFTDLVVGLSVGSEDLYRNSPTGIENDSGVGANPADVVNYISQVKKALSGTPLSDVSIGHVDTWNAWTNGSNSAVIDAIDWLGVDEYPYFQNTESNSIDDAYSLFWAAYNATAGAAGGKPVWITETGWPVSGKAENLAIASLSNAQTFWDQVGCASAFDKVNTWWYVLQDAAPTAPNPSFGLVGSSSSDATLSTTPLYDLSCANVTLPSSLLPSSTATKSTSTGTGTLTTATTTGSPTGGSSQSSSTKGSSASSASSTATSAASGASTLVASSSFLGCVMFAVAALF
jgi:glucan endo-1,3-beta-D-glucosidase